MISYKDVTARQTGPKHARFNERMYSENPWLKREEKKETFHWVIRPAIAANNFESTRRTCVLLLKRSPLIHHIFRVSRGQPVIYHKIWGLVPSGPRLLCNGA